MSKNTTTTVGFPEDGDEARVQNLSGAPGEGYQALRPGSHLGEHRPPRPGRKDQLEIDAESGEALGTYTAQALAHAVHRADQEHFARQKDTSPAAYLGHVFGLRGRTYWVRLPWNVSGTWRPRQVRAPQREVAHVDGDRRCIQCGRPLEGRRSDAVFCRQRCKRRYYRRMASSNYQEPPPAGTAWPSGDRADERWRQQYERHEEATRPLSREERAALDWQRRNRGVLHPLLAARWVEAECARVRREAAEYAARQPLKVEDPRDRSSLGSLSRHARESRRLNRPADPHLSILRPGPSSGHGPWDDDGNQCIDAPWSRGRW